MIDLMAEGRKIKRNFDFIDKARRLLEHNDIDFAGVFPTEIAIKKHVLGQLGGIAEYLKSSKTQKWYVLTVFEESALYIEDDQNRGDFYFYSMLPTPSIKKRLNGRHT